MRAMATATRGLQLARERSDASQMMRTAGIALTELGFAQRSRRGRSKEPFQGSCLIALLALVLSSCGGSSGGSCGKVEPCGGPVAGTWKAATTCNNPAVFNNILADCAGAHATAENGSPAGSMVLNADLTYAMSLSVPFVVSVSIPLSCTTAATCADLAATLAETLTGHSEPSNSVVCSGNSTCSCVLTQTGSLSGTGTYTTSGTTLTLTDDTGYSNSATYCVQSNTLHLVDVDMSMNMGPMGQATITDDVTLNKQ